MRRFLAGILGGFEMILLICENCEWSGYPEELVSKTEALDDKDFSYCPYCDGKEFEEIDEDEDED